MTAPARDGAARMADLRTRTLSGLALAAFAAAPIALGGPVAALFIAAMGAAMGWEFRRITVGPRDAAAYAAGIAAAVLLAGLGQGAAGLGLLAATGAGFALIDARATRPPGWAMVGAATAGLAALAFATLRGMEPHGLNIAVWIAVIVVATDTGAYFAGRLIGGPKLWPRVSPKKTWAGLGGGMALAALCGGLFSWATTGTYAGEVTTVSALAAMVAQGGDLAESALKRRFGVKDSGRLMPGHGGALDRLDGFAAATLVAAAVTLLRDKPVFMW